MKTKALRLKLAALAGIVVAAIAGIINLPGTALATPGVNFNSEILARSFFEEIQVNTGRHGHHGDRDRADRSGSDDDVDADRTHKVKIVARDPSDVYVVRNKVPPGGSSGWHTHPGPSVVSVKSGTATVYDGDDPSCTPVTYPAGTGFIDAGGGHLHMVRNEGTVDLETVAFQIVPAGAARRIDAPDPGFCPF
jgi:hypothetical protein